MLQEAVFKGISIWKHSSGILVHINMASHSYIFVSSMSIMQIYCSSTSQRWFIVMFKKLVWALWHGVLSCWK